MGRAFATLGSLRKQLPLPVRMGYGWLKRRFAPGTTIWRNEEFERYYRWLQETQWWSRDQLESLQLEQLQALVKHAYENVPYYRRVFDERHLKPDDISTLNDVRRLPILTKEDVRSNADQLIARNVDRARLRYGTTGGSSGRPLGLYHDKHTKDLHEAAFILRQRSWGGYQPGDRLVILRGHLANMARGGEGRVWDFDADHNRLVLLGLDMNEESMTEYIKQIRKFRPKFIYSYPSSLEILSRFMRRNGIEYGDTSAIFCESETLYPGQRKLIESQFGCKIFAGYGLTERVADATECECHEGYHVSMEYGVLELLDKNGDPMTKAGTLGRVIGTGFDTYCMPLIRYATDDLALYATRQCDCKRQSDLIGDFKGRIREFLVSKAGRLVPFGPLYSTFTYEVPTWGKVREVQFIQEQEGVVTVEVAGALSSSEREMVQDLEGSIYEWLDHEEFDIRIALVDRVARTGRGKLGLLQQRLPIRFEDFGQDAINGTQAA
jgi:phenylacetate-CoA ligase